MSNDNPGELSDIDSPVPGCAGPGSAAGEPAHCSPDRAWRPIDVAFYLHISENALGTLRARDESFPKPVLVLPNRPRWHPSSVHAWLRGTPMEPVREPLTDPPSAPSTARIDDLPPDESPRVFAPAQPRKPSKHPNRKSSDRVR